MAERRDPDGSLRLFFALWPDEATRARLAGLQGALAGRRTEPRNLHLTLAFLGQQAGATLQVLRDILAGLPRRRFDLQLDQAGYFPRNRIAWVGAALTPAPLTALYQSLVQGLDGAAVECKLASRFRPHVTLARDAPAGPQPVAEPIVWPVRTVALVHSEIGGGPSRYRVLASLPLEDAAQ